MAEIVGPAKTAEALHARFEAGIAAPFHLPRVAQLRTRLRGGSQLALQQKIQIGLNGAELVLEHRPDLEHVPAVGVITRQLGEEPDIYPVTTGLGQRENVLPLELVELGRLARQSGIAHRKLTLPPRSK